MYRLHQILPKLALGLAAAILVTAASAQTGKLKTKIKPGDAAVFINGEYYGHADEFNGPGQHLSLTPGEYKLRCTLAYYQDHEETVTIEPGEKTVVKHQMAPSDEERPTGPFAKVKLKVQPDEDVAVLINGRFIGHADEFNAPGQTLLLKPGTYKIELRKTGYQTHTTTLEAQANQKHKLRIQLRQ